MFFRYTVAMNLLSAGAAETVTGSCHLIELSGLKILIDCGLFQGPKRIESLNLDPFPFKVSDLDVILLTHGHLDHVGRLPLLIKQGYTGPIYTIESTIKIAEVILLDSAKIQLNDYERSLRKAKRSGREQDVDKPLYTEAEVEKTINLLRPVQFERPVALGKTVEATFIPAGHILGSAFIELNSADGRVICSGDLGNRESSIQADARSPREADAVLVESTYGNRTHRKLAATLNEFRQVLTDSLKSGGKVMIPSFSLERTQAILYNLKQMQDRGEIPSMPIFLDSPMASKMTKFYMECANEFIGEVKQELLQGRDPFEPDSLKYTVTADESKAINNYDGQAIIIAGSGMMTGGRILHHLKHNLWREDASLVVVGYQAEGTLGRRIIDGAESVRMFGEEVVVRASKHTIGGFSAHADQDDLLEWLKHTGKAKIYMVHGEVDVMTDFKTTLANHNREALMVERAKPYSLG